MIYVTSDIGGIPFGQFCSFLRDGLHFTKNDYLFILGDVIGENESGGIDIIGKISKCENIQLVLGDKELVFLEAMKKRSTRIMFSGYIRKAVKAFYKLSPEQKTDIISFLIDCPLFDSAEDRNGRSYIFTHAGLQNFSPTKKLSEYTPKELTTGFPALPDEKYFMDKDITVIFGHTDVSKIGREYTDRIFSNGYTANVCTAYSGSALPSFLRLEDNEKFYMNKR